MTQIAPDAAMPEAVPERGVSLVSSSDIALRLPGLSRDGWLTVELPIPGPVGRGCLASLFDDAVESSLASQGCCAAGLVSNHDLDSLLSDQLYRARSSGLRGICVIVPPLQGLSGTAGVLDADDSATLRWWLEAASTHRVALLVDDANRYLGVYGPPSPLHRLISLDGGERGLAGGSLGPSEPGAALRARAEITPVASETTGKRDLDGSLSHAGLDGVPPRDSTLNPGCHLEAPACDPDALDEPAADSANAVAIQDTAPAAFHGHDRHENHEELTLQLRAPRPRERRREEPPPMFPEAAEAWPRWVHELESARGPKPLSVVERLYTSAYCPLREAAMRGIAPNSAVEVAQRWAASFEQSYAEAFNALRLRGKRPAMVLDIPDLALRAGRLHGARTVQLILVDAMRFDLGLRVHYHLQRALGDSAMLIERILTWSALPSTTSVQLELMGRGADGLRDRTAGLDSEVTVARGRAAQTLRRIKAGTRDLLKLDAIESNLCERGPAALERLDSVATSVAEPLANYLVQLPPRTLAMVFGDHGFVIDSDTNGTTAGRHGGASPDEVLVPAFAWLTGATH